MQNSKEEENFIVMKCFMCLKDFRVPLDAKFITCPHCGFHREFDAAENMDGLKKLMRKVFGDAPDKPDNN